MAKEPFHKTIVRALDKTADRDVLQALADLLHETEVPEEDVLEIANALEHARRRIPHTQTLPNDSIYRALDSLVEQMH